MTITNYHLQQRVANFGARLDEAQVVVVLVHGRTLSPEYMNDFVVKRLALEKVAYLAPAAAENSWYPKGFLEPLSENQPAIDFTLQTLETISNQLFEKGFPPQRIIWCGFSQGACALSQFLAKHPRRWGALIAFTGGLIGPPGTNWAIEGNFVGMPAYFCTSDIDPHIPEFRVRETAAVFEIAGADVKTEFFIGRSHEISDKEIDQARTMILNVLAETI